MFKTVWKSIFRILFFSILVSHPGLAQEINRLYSSTDGLNAVINDIDFDEYGFAWLATEKGLYRASSTNLSRISLGADFNSLIDEYFLSVQYIGEDKVLVDTNNNGIYYFDFSTHQFAPLASLTPFQKYSHGRLQRVTSFEDGKKVWLCSS